MVDSIDNAAGVVTLKRNDKWWGRAPKLETIIFTLVSQQQLPSAFANGELDALDGIADGDTYSQATSRDDVERSEEHTSELQSRGHLVCRLLLEKKKKTE